MNDNDATEIAYKNGYEAGKKDAREEIFQTHLVVPKLTKEQEKLLVEQLRNIKPMVLINHQEPQIEVVNQPKWIPVGERLPKKDGRYLVLKNIYGTIRHDVMGFAKDGRKVDKYDFEREWENVWYLYDSDWGHMTSDCVTHWMPLPEPPKGDA